MKAKFAEKTYETLMNLELTKNNKIFAPGQVCEHHIGIDAAMYTEHSILKELFGYSSTPSGDDLDELWENHEDKFDSDTFPKFKCNLFIQYKRPQYINRSNGKEFAIWNKPYFRYDIESCQQHVLFKLEQNLSSESIVAYVCSAFWKNTELWNFWKNKELVENSNFVKPSQLNNHNRYTFINRGDYGHACSEPMKLTNMNILKTINSMLKNNNFENNSYFISSLNKSIKKTVPELDKESQFAFNSMANQLKTIDNKLRRNIANIRIFTFITNINWLIGYECRQTADL